MRYACLSICDTLRMVSSKVMKRFPTYEHMVDAGLMTTKEVREGGISKNIKLIRPRYFSSQGPDSITSQNISIKISLKMFPTIIKSGLFEAVRLRFSKNLGEKFREVTESGPIFGFEKHCIRCSTNFYRWNASATGSPGRRTSPTCTGCRSPGAPP